MLRYLHPPVLRLFTTLFLIHNLPAQSESQLATASPRRAMIRKDSLQPLTQEKH
jgi:hypothetical protein